MDIEVLEYNFNVELLTTECHQIIKKVGLHKHHNQISLKHTTNTELGNPWYQGCGSLKYKFGENFIDSSGNLKEAEVKLTQYDFKILNTALEDTYLQYVHNTIANDYNFGRMRIMAMPHKKCMSIHTDTSKRIHIPIVTNENCLMIIDNQVHHMPADGNAYLTDTTKPHTALNANHSFMRLHLLFDLY
jgi:hypothetical protein